MPLAFPSKSHATIVFGFFNIESDMLLLNGYFFFADRFCQAVGELDQGSSAATFETSLPGWLIDDPYKVGNVNAAIQGIDLTGFIGATYRKFPFPKDPQGFKQKPYGAENQAIFSELIAGFSKPQSIRLGWQAADQTVSLAEITFERDQFMQLVGYVDRGGYPRWKNEVRPAYVVALMEKLGASESALALNKST
jgi:hypothetical protein